MTTHEQLEEQIDDDTNRVIRRELILMVLGSVFALVGAASLYVATIYIDQKVHESIDEHEKRVFDKINDLESLIGESGRVAQNNSRYIEGLEDRFQDRMNSVDTQLGRIEGLNQLLIERIVKDVDNAHNRPDIRTAHSEGAQ